MSADRTSPAHNAAAYIKTKWQAGLDSDFPLTKRGDSVCIPLRCHTCGHHLRVLGIRTSPENITWILVRADSLRLSVSSTPLPFVLRFRKMLRTTKIVRPAVLLGATITTNARPINSNQRRRCWKNLLIADCAHHWSNNKRAHACASDATSLVKPNPVFGCNWRTAFWNSC